MMSTTARTKSDQASPEQSSELLPWQWPEARWRGIVEKVRAGRSLKPKSWPGGAPGRRRSLPSTATHESGELRGGRLVARPALARAIRPTGSACRASSTCSSRHGVAGKAFYVPAVHRAALSRGAAPASSPARARDRHSWLDFTSATPSFDYKDERELMFRSADTLARITGKAAGRHAHAVLGFQPAHAADRARAGTALRQLADGR